MIRRCDHSQTRPWSIPSVWKRHDVHNPPSGKKSSCGIGPKGIRRTHHITTIFNGIKYKAPKSINAGRVSGTAQRMEGTVTPLAQKLGITIDTGVKV